MALVASVVSVGADWYSVRLILDLCLLVNTPFSLFLNTPILTPTLRLNTHNVAHNCAITKTISGGLAVFLFPRRLQTEMPDQSSGGPVVALAEICGTPPTPHLKYSDSFQKYSSPNLKVFQPPL